MEHVITIALNINDDDLKAKIEETVQREVTRKLLENLTSYMLNRFGGVTGVTREVIASFMRQYKKEILDTAVKDVAVSLKRGKKYKAALKRIDEIVDELEAYAAELDEEESDLEDEEDGE